MATTVDTHPLSEQQHVASNVAASKCATLPNDDVPMEANRIMVLSEAGRQVINENVESVKLLKSFPLKVKSQCFPRREQQEEETRECSSLEVSLENLKDRQIQKEKQQKLRDPQTVECSNIQLTSYPYRKPKWGRKFPLKYPQNKPDDVETKKKLKKCLDTQNPTKWIRRMKSRRGSNVTSCSITGEVDKSAEKHEVPIKPTLISKKRSRRGSVQRENVEINRMVASQAHETTGTVSTIVKTTKFPSRVICKSMKQFPCISSQSNSTIAVTKKSANNPISETATGDVASQLEELAKFRAKNSNQQKFSKTLRTSNFPLTAINLKPTSFPLETPTKGSEIQLNKKTKDYESDTNARQQRFPLIYHKRFTANQFPHHHEGLIPVERDFFNETASAVNDITKTLKNLIFENDKFAVKPLLQQRTSGSMNCLHFPLMRKLNNHSTPNFPLLHLTSDISAIPSQTSTDLMENPITISSQNHKLLIAPKIDNNDTMCTITTFSITMTHQQPTDQQQHQHQQQYANYDAAKNNLILPKVLAKNKQIVAVEIERSSNAAIEEETTKTAVRSNENMNDTLLQLGAQPTIPRGTHQTPPVASGAAIEAPTASGGQQLKDHANFHNLSQRPAPPASCSDVRDTSSQTVLWANNDRAVSPVRTPTLSSAQLENRANSPNLDIYTNRAADTKEHYAELRDFLVDIHVDYVTSSYFNASNGNNDHYITAHVTVDEATPALTSYVTQERELTECASSEMTVTKVVDCEEDNLSIASSTSDDQRKLSDVESQPSTAEVDDMKYEMKRAGGESRALGSSSYAPLSRRSTLNQHPPGAINSSLNVKAPTSHNHINVKAHPPMQVTPPLHAKPDTSRLYAARNEPRSVQNNARIPTRASVPERVGVGNVSGVLAAATDINKLANFGKPRRAEQALTGGTKSLDVLDSSVLPTRTLLRRQRRLQPQGSEDKPEDALERLNKLKARISASLSEVKGVLQHYSVDEGDEQQEKAGVVNKRILPRSATLPSVGITEYSALSNRNEADEKGKELNEKNENGEVKNQVQEEQKDEQKKEEKAQNEANKDEGPVNFRFVKKVRRRSTFADDDDNDKKMEVVCNEVKVGSGAEGSAEEMKNDDQAAKNLKENKETEKITESKDTICHSEVEKVKDQIKDLKVENQNKNQETDQERKDIKEPVAVAAINEVQQQSENQNKAPDVKETENAAAKTKKRVVIVKKKNDPRRASIAAVEPSKIEPPVKDETAMQIKAQRRPSDSEAVLKKKVLAINKKKLLTKQAHTEGDEQLQAVTEIHKVDKKESTDQSTQVETIKNANQSEAVELSSLPTVNEEKSSDQSEESSSEAKFKEIKQPDTNEGDSANKVKHRLSLKSKDGTRRASIAAVEGSRIKPPADASLSLSVKAQRRPSDSEAIVKKRSPAQSETESTPKVRLITKVKRPSVKSKTSATAPVATAAATPADANETAINSRKDEMSQITTSKTTSATTTLDTTAKTLPTQLAIDDASLNITEAPRANISGRSSGTTIDTRSPTKLDEQNGSRMVATLASPLRASEPSGQASADKIQLQQLAELVGETLIVTPTRQPKDNATTQSTELSRTTQPGQLVENLKITGTQSTQPSDNIKNLINQTRPPTDNDDTPQVTPSITATTKTANEQVSSVEGKQTAAFEAKASSIEAAADATKSNNRAYNEISVSAPVNTATATASHPPQSDSTQKVDSKMPELQVLPAPVQVCDPKDTTPPFQVTKEPYAPTPTTKKTILKRIVRKNSIEKALAKQKSIEKVKEKDEAKNEIKAENDKAAEEGPIVAPIDTDKPEEVCTNEVPEEAPQVEKPAPPKRVRKIKKKVIIKRVQRKLSVSDPFFNMSPVERNDKPAEVETLEKAISYVTDDEEDEVDAKQAEEEQVVPLKSCLKTREYEIGDWVLYGERFKRTQIRWKKGQIIERITSISYKIDIDGTEVSAHISYIKKWTDRKVKFSGKEYLEIDYEQIAQEEQRARNYSIWNMV